MKTPAETIKDFFKDYPTKRLGKGQIMLRPGDMIEKVYYLNEGSVIEYAISPAGNTIIVNVFKPGTFFPMSSVLNEKPSEFFFEAGAAVSLKVAPAEHASEMLADNPDVTLDLLRRVYNGTDGILRRMTHLMGGSALSRLIFELLNAGYRFGQSNPNGSTFINLSENDIAMRAGLSRETVNRMMRQLKNSGNVKVIKNGIEVKNLSELQELLDSTT